jgi:hypothetical protein
MWRMIRVFGMVGVIWVFGMVWLLALIGLRILLVGHERLLSIWFPAWRHCVVT